MCIVKGTSFSVFLKKSASSAWACIWAPLEVSANISLKFAIRSPFSVVAADNKSAWFKVASAPGTGTVVYFPLI